MHCQTAGSGGMYLLQFRFGSGFMASLLFQVMLHLLQLPAGFHMVLARGGQIIVLQLER